MFYWILKKTFCLQFTPIRFRGRTFKCFQFKIKIILSITLTILKHFRSVINVNGYKNELHVKWVKKSGSTL